MQACATKTTANVHQKAKSYSCSLSARADQHRRERSSKEYGATVFLAVARGSCAERASRDAVEIDTGADREI